ncbi:UbiD family decarboxylase, partial [Chloroflexota bacterium]
MTEDLRDWLTRVEGIEELKKLDGADWDLEIGYLTAMNWLKKGPALLFDNIRGYPEGWRVLTCSTSTRSRTALTLGLPIDASDKELMEIVRQRLSQWQANLDDFAPKVVKQGPLMQNIWDKDEVDLLRFPTPKWHEEDGGRYIGTGHLVITRDPDTGEVNLGTYRVMLHDAKTVGISIAPGKHGQLHIQKYHERGQPCPIAISLGQHPLLFWLSAFGVPEGEEYAYIGAIRGKPVEVIEEEITGLPIPADSEIVLVGWCPPGKTHLEGPFGEFTGYYASGERQNPIIEVERVYFRNHPIMLGSPPGRPPNDTDYYFSLLANVMSENELKRCGIPEVKGVWNHSIVGAM